MRGKSRKQHFNQSCKVTEFKRQHVIGELVKLDIHRVASGAKLHECDYPELKWHFAVEMAKREI